MPNVIQADSIEAVSDAVRVSKTLRIASGGSKNLDLLSPSFGFLPIQNGAPEPTILDVRKLTGIVEYDPSEFTLTARAGTPIAEIQKQMDHHGQFMPFDPPLADLGASLGGTISAGISGPSRLRFGGVRDFIIGVRLVDGTGTLVTGGGKVVKNAAGFDIPKMMVGTWGEFGVLTEVTLKVFPRPVEYRTIRIDGRNLSNAISLMNRLASAPLDLEALDMEPSGVLFARLGGLPVATKNSAERVLTFSGERGEIIEPGNDEQSIWNSIRDWSWHKELEGLVRVPLTSARIAALDAFLAPMHARRRYSIAGNVAWIAWPIEQPIDALHGALSAQELAGRILRWHATSLGESNGGPTIRTRIGLSKTESFSVRIKKALDPNHRFVERE